MSDDCAVRTVPKIVAEYPLPATAQTHELAYVGNGMLVVTQQTDSVLVQVALDPGTGRPLEAMGHLMGTSRSGLHGLCVSRTHLGCVWTTLQFDDKIQLVRPGATVDAPPEVLQELDVPRPARGPHVVVECGDEVWTTCKDSSHVVRLGGPGPNAAAVYPTSRRPIFVAKHPISGVVHASLDKSSRIACVDPKSGSTWEIGIPADEGTTPVGLVAGPDGNVWFVLLGGSSGGTGTFGKIDDIGQITWFRLTAMSASSAGLLHLAWSKTPGGRDVLWLLASSISSMMLPNAVIRVTFDGGFGRVATQQSYSLPTQMCMAHRVVPVGASLYVSEMMSSVIAHLPVAEAPSPPVDEASDYYADFGLGQPARHVVYADPYGPV